MIQKFARLCIVLLWVALLWIPIGSGNAQAAEDFTNVALGKTTSSLNVYSASYPTSKAVDGSKTGYYCSSSTRGDQWLEVDLGDNYYIDRVEISPEPAYRKGLANFDLLISESPFSPTSTLEQDRAQASQGGTQIFFEGQIAEDPGVLTVGNFGRYVRIREPNAATWFTIDELKVYGSENAPPIDLGPLTDLEGKWFGQGWNIIAIPIEAQRSTQTICDSETGSENFCVHAEPYCEILDISGGFNVQNRLFPETLEIFGLEYDQQVFSPKGWQPGDPLPDCLDDFANSEDFDVIHGEKGTWLLLGEAGTTQNIVRTFSLPRGNIILAAGQAKSENLDAIPQTGGFPVANLGSFLALYNTPYSTLDSLLGDALNLQNPNEVLDKAIVKGNAMVLEVSTDNTGGAIASIPLLDRPNDVEGAFRVPAFKSTFWIENIDDKDNLQLQYSQTTDIDFLKDISGDLILWPHVDVSTLRKDTECK